MTGFHQSVSYSFKKLISPGVSVLRAPLNSYSKRGAIEIRLLSSCDIATLRGDLPGKAHRQRTAVGPLDGLLDGLWTVFWTVVPWFIQRIRTKRVEQTEREPSD